MAADSPTAGSSLTMLDDGHAQSVAMLLDHAVSSLHDSADALARIASLLREPSSTSESSKNPRVDGTKSMVSAEEAAPTNKAEIKRQEADALFKAGRYADSVIAYTEILVRRPDWTEVEDSLAKSLLFSGKYDAAAGALRRLFHRTYGLGAAMRQRFTPTPGLGTTLSGSATPFKHLDRADQIDYLLTLGKIDDSFGALSQRYREVAATIAQDPSAQAHASLDPVYRERLGGYLTKALYYRDTPTLDAQALNPALSSSDIEEEYLANGRVICIDDLLSPEALDELQSFFRESTVFFRASEAGFVASYADSGCNSRAIFQLARELTANLPRIFNSYRLANAWCYRHAAKGDGVRTHNHGGSIALNYWFGPSQANLDADGEGMTIFRKGAPETWDWRAYNLAKNEAWVQDAIAAHLQDAESLSIAHRCNRGVVFDSSLFHKTDPINFRDDFFGRRMSLTLEFARLPS